MLCGSGPQLLAQGLVSWKTNFHRLGLGGRGGSGRGNGSDGKRQMKLRLLMAAHACCAAWLADAGPAQATRALGMGDSCCGGQNSGLDSYQRSHLLSILCVLVTWWKVSSFPFTSKDRGLGDPD